MKSAEIRQAFLDFFKSQGHQVVTSSPLVPEEDPTLLFTNAGMVQFKDTFLGLESRRYTRASTAQKCLRAGGKHNDLENVGYTARHHTFFEMLGNFSFGDYFKRDAIHFAWTFLTEILKLPKEKLWVTVFLDDDEAADIWANDIGVPLERITRCGEKDNFWSMGDTGPCGPCTEIFYDHGDTIWGGPPGTPEAEGDRYIEIWNLVFMQYNRDKDGTLHPLPKPSVDTGMGLERIAAVMQGVHNNYEIDTFKHLTQAVCRLGADIDVNNPSIKVIADHIRACAFLIADGVLPGNEGRGYVLRRIIRRAIRHGNKLKLQTPFFHRLVLPLVEVMGAHYQELKTHQSTIEQILLQEEHQFTKTIESGLSLLQEEISQLKNKVIPGSVAFKLYDTYGFPSDLTADIAREQGLTVDMAGFEVEMNKQRQLSQQKGQFDVDYNKILKVNLSTNFSGYAHEGTQATILEIYKEGQPIQTLSQGEKGCLILDDSPFYAESGGQVGDKGRITSPNGRFIVEDTQKSGQAILHMGYVEQGQLDVQQSVEAEIDSERRQAIRLNHTATHILHAALREILGSHVAQKGSLVDASRARFDFSHFSPLTPAERFAIEAWVNDKIRQNVPVITEEMSYDKAQNSGALALFGEKYADEVRVLSLGEFSKELCGGTHAKRTGDIALFKIVAESGVASGVRRLEWVTGVHALNWVNANLQLLEDISLQLKSTPSNLQSKVQQLLEDMKCNERELQKLQEKLTAHSSGSILERMKKINTVGLLVEELKDSDMQTLRQTLDQLKSRVETGVVVLYSIAGDKINVVAGLSKDLIGRVPHAPEYVRILCGKGGGREDMAQGGGKVPLELADKINEIEIAVRAALD